MTYDDNPSHCVLSDFKVQSCGYPQRRDKNSNNMPKIKKSGGRSQKLAIYHHGYSFSTRAAQVLNSGIREMGSRAGLVRLLTRPAPPQWKGTNRVSERIVGVIRAGTSTCPRRLTTRTSSPSPMPYRSAKCGCISTN